MVALKASPYLCIFLAAAVASLAAWDPLACCAQDALTAPARTLVVTQGWVCLVNTRAELMCKLLGRDEGRQIKDWEYRLPTLEQVAGVSDVLELDAHGKYLCALDKRGAVQCWGCVSDHDCKLWPSQVALPEPAQHIAVSSDGACALLRSGAIQCWGAAPATRVKDQGGHWYERPTAVALARDVKQLVAAAHGYCALHAGGTVSCWGGCADAACRPALPTRIAGVEDASMIASGLSFGCAIVGPQRDVSCWGLSEQTLRAASQGNAPAEHLLEAATRIPGLRDIKQLAAGHLFAVALANDGAVYHWGGYYEPGIRQLGRAAQTDPSESPRQHTPLLVDLRPARIGDVRARAAIVGNNYLCLQTEQTELICERALARTKPFNVREAWPQVRFELPHAPRASP